MLSDDDFRTLLDHLNRPWAGFRRVRKGVKKRVRRHMTALGCRTIGDYLALLDTDARIHAACERHLLVPISRFFRDRQLWIQLQRRILPALSTRFPEGIRAWSAGCAGGEEPYSLAMAWEAAAETTAGIAPITILATDADATCLDRARAGRYPQSSLKEVPEAMRRRWFRRIPGTKLYQVINNPGGCIHWHCHHLLDAPPGEDFNLILLRNNLLTYYQGPRLEAAVNAIVGHLAEDGRLVIGAHEHLPANPPPLSRDPVCPWIYWRRRDCVG
jgi:chemotaxis protein methyltransferase CheR